MQGKCKKYANKNIDDLSNELWTLLNSCPKALLPPIFRKSHSLQS